MLQYRWLREKIRRRKLPVFLTGAVWCFHTEKCLQLFLFSCRWKEEQCRQCHSQRAAAAGLLLFCQLSQQQQQQQQQPRPNPETQPDQQRRRARHTADPPQFTVSVTEQWHETHAHLCSSSGLPRRSCFHQCLSLSQQNNSKINELISITFCGGVQHDPQVILSDVEVDPEMQIDSKCSTSLFKIRELLTD